MDWGFALFLIGVGTGVAAIAHNVRYAVKQQGKRNRERDEKHMAHSVMNVRAYRTDDTDDIFPPSEPVLSLADQVIRDEGWDVIDQGGVKVPIKAWCAADSLEKIAAVYEQALEQLVAKLHPEKVAARAAELASRNSRVHEGMHRITGSQGLPVDVHPLGGCKDCWSLKHEGGCECPGCMSKMTDAKKQELAEYAAILDHHQREINAARAVPPTQMSGRGYRPIPHSNVLAPAITSQSWGDYSMTTIPVKQICPVCSLYLDGPEHLNCQSKLDKLVGQKMKQQAALQAEREAHRKIVTEAMTKNVIMYPKDGMITTSYPNHTVAIRDPDTDQVLGYVVTENGEVKTTLMPDQLVPPIAVDPAIIDWSKK